MGARVSTQVLKPRPTPVVVIMSPRRQTTHLRRVVQEERRRRRRVVVVARRAPVLGRVRLHDVERLYRITSRAVVVPSSTYGGGDSKNVVSSGAVVPRRLVGRPCPTDHSSRLSPSLTFSHILWFDVPHAVRRISLPSSTVVRRISLPSSIVVRRVSLPSLTVRRVSPLPSLSPFVASLPSHRCPSLPSHLRARSSLLSPTVGRDPSPLAVSWSEQRVVTLRV